MELDPIDKVIMDTTLSSIENLNTQIGIVSREIFRYAWESEDVKLLEDYLKAVDFLTIDDTMAGAHL